METFAVYWEPIIKTYGIAERTGLCLVTLDLPFNRISDGGNRLTRFASRFEGSLVLIFSRPATPTGLHLHLLLDRLPENLESLGSADVIEKHVQPDRPLNAIPSAFNAGGSGLRVDNLVELVYFQGPHYGDRYGIAGAAVTALAQHGVPLLAVVCTGASVYLITPKGMACAARNALGKAFSTPEPA
jgi:hypothetical protein